MVPSPLVDPAYGALLESLKERVQQARIRTALAANRELVLLYWSIGREVLARQAELGWGAKVVDRLSRDLRAAFPEMKGFSARNLKYMRAFAEAWPSEEFVQQAAALLPWFHHCTLLDKVAAPAARQFYIEQAAEHGWSRARLVQQIERGLHERQSAAVTNFARTLPTTRSDLATQILRDPYVFDFLGLTDAAQEREIEQALIAHIRDTLVEMGVGFAFVGNQVRLEVAGEDLGDAHRGDCAPVHIRLGNSPSYAPPEHGRRARRSCGAALA